MHPPPAPGAEQINHKLNYDHSSSPSLHSYSCMAIGNNRFASKTD